MGQCTIVVIIDLVARRYAILAPNPNASQVPARARNRRLVCHGRPKSRGRQTAALCRSNRKPTDRPTTAYGAVQPVTVDVAYGRRCPTSAVRNTRRDRLNRGVTCRSEFTRPAKRSSSEQTFAHWRRGMGSQSSFRQPGLGHSVRQMRYRRGDEKSAGNGLLNSASTRRREPRPSNTRSGRKSACRES